MGNTPSATDDSGSFAVDSTQATPLSSFKDVKNRYLDAAAAAAASVDSNNKTLTTTTDNNAISSNSTRNGSRPSSSSSSSKQQETNKLQSWPPPPIVSSPTPQQQANGSISSSKLNNGNNNKRNSAAVSSKSNKKGDNDDDDDGNQQGSLLREAMAAKRTSSIWDLPSVLFGVNNIDISEEEIVPTVSSSEGLHNNDGERRPQQQSRDSSSSSKNNDQLDVTYWKKIERNHRRSIRKQQKHKTKLLEEVKEQHQQHNTIGKERVGKKHSKDEKNNEEAMITVVTPETQKQEVTPIAKTNQLPIRLPFLSSLSPPATPTVISPLLDKSKSSTPKKDLHKSSSSSSSSTYSSPLKDSSSSSPSNGISPRRASSKNSNKDWIQKRQAAYLSALATPGRAEKKKVDLTPTKTPTRRIKALNIATPKRAKKDSIGTKTPPPKRRGRKKPSFNNDDDADDGGGGTEFLNGYITSVLSRLSDSESSDCKYSNEIRESIKIIFDCKGFPKTRRLSMRDNDLICTVVGAIQNDSSVTSIDVDCEPSYFGTVSTSLLTQFVDSLKLNVHLTHLTLRGVELGNDILKQLANGPLEMNFTLQAIDLSLNCFTSEGLSEFLISIGNFNSSLTALCLEDQTTPISIASQPDVLDAISKNYSLREINVDFQSEEEGKELLLKILERNRQYRLTQGTNNKTNNLDMKIVEVYRDMAEVAKSLDEERKMEDLLIVDLPETLDIDWNYFYELAVLFDKHKLKKEIQAESDDPTGSKKLMEDNANLTGKAKSEFLFGKFKDIMEDSVACFNSDGSFLTDVFISKFLVEDPDTTAVVFDFHGQWKLFKRFPPQDPHRNLIVTKFVDAIVSHSRADEFTGISMANTGCGDDFLVTLSERLIGDSTLLPNLQMINFETNYINETGVVALSKLISHPKAAKYLQVVRLENQKGLLKSKAEVTLMKAMSVNRSVVVLGLRLRNLLEKQQIGKYLVRNIDLIRQARQRHAKDTGTQRKRNEVEQIFDRVAMNDPNIGKVDMSTQKRFLTLTGEEKCKAASSLAVNKFVKSVNFTSCGIDDEFAMELGKALRSNDTIEKLFFENNSISGDGIKAIFEGLARNGSIEEIRLHHQSKLTNSGDEELLAEIIESNTTIITIGIDLRSTVARVKLDRKLKLNRNKQLQLRRAESDQQQDAEEMEAKGNGEDKEKSKEQSEAEGSEEGLAATEAAEAAGLKALEESKEESNLEVTEVSRQQGLESSNYEAQQDETVETEEGGSESIAVSKAAKVAETQASAESDDESNFETAVNPVQHGLESTVAADKTGGNDFSSEGKGKDAQKIAEENLEPSHVQDSEEDLPLVDSESGTKHVGVEEESEQAEQQPSALEAVADDNDKVDARVDNETEQLGERESAHSDVANDNNKADAQFVDDETEEQSEEHRSAHAAVAEALPKSTMAERERFLTARKWDIPATIDTLGNYVDWNSKHEEIAKEHNIERQTTDNPDRDIWIQVCSIAMKANGETGDHALPQVIRTYNKSADNEVLTDLAGHRIFHTMPAQMDNTLAHGSTYALATALFINLHLDRNHNERITVCMDFRAGQGWPNIHAMNQVPFMTDTTKLLLSLFPNRLHKCLVFPVPSTFYWIWTVISKIIEPVTAEKICVLSGANRIVSPPPLDGMTPHLGKDVAEFLEEARVADFKE